MVQQQADRASLLENIPGNLCSQFKVAFRCKLRIMKTCLNKEETFALGLKLAGQLQESGMGIRQFPRIVNSYLFQQLLMSNDNGMKVK